MHSAKLVLPLAAVVFAAAACGKADNGAADTAVATTGARTAAPAATPAPAPTLTAAAGETAKPSPAAAQSGVARVTRTSPAAPRATPAAADTAGARVAPAAPAADTTHNTKPAAAPPSAPQAAPVQPAATTASPAAALPDSLGRPAYDGNCRRCHGVRGVPPRTMAAKYPKIPTFDAAFVARVSADSIVLVLDRGVNDDMKSFKDKLSRDEMRAVAAYLRAFAR